MKNNEVEIVKYPRVKHIRMIANAICYKEDHMHNDFEIAYLLKGNAILEINGVAHDLSAGDIFFINSGDVHSYQVKDKDVLDKFTKNNNPIDSETDLPVFLFVQISNHFVREYFPQIRTTVFKSNSLKSFLTESERNVLPMLLLEAGECYFSQKEYAPLELVSDICKVVTIMYKRVPHEIINEGQKEKLKRKNARIERIISYIDENFDSQIRLEDLARMEGLSITHFSHLFSSAFNVTFQEFISIKRLEQCIRLMSNKGKSLLEISYESGFSDPKYMNKMFIKKFGCTPKEYRKNLLNNPIEQRDPTNGTLEKIFNESDSITLIVDARKEIEHNLTELVHN